MSRSRSTIGRVEQVHASPLSSLTHLVRHDREAAARMADLPTMNKRVLWTAKEEEILRREVANTKFRGFQNVLERHRVYFHSSRTAKSLEAHFYRMKRTGSLAKDGEPVIESELDLDDASPAINPTATTTEESPACSPTSATAVSRLGRCNQRRLTSCLARNSQAPSSTRFGS